MNAGSVSPFRRRVWKKLQSHTEVYLYLLYLLHNEQGELFSIHCCQYRKYNTCVTYTESGCGKNYNICLVLPALPVTQLISWCANDPDHPKRSAFCRSGMNMPQIIWIIQKRQSAAKSVMTVFLQMIQIIQSGRPFAKKTGWYKDVANDLDKLFYCKVDSP